MHLGPELSWPSDATLVFRGGAAAEHFCLGGDPSQANLASGAFLDGLPAYASLLERLQQARNPIPHRRLRHAPSAEPHPCAQVRLPTIAVCHGATRGGGMLFPCVATVVLAHTDATFGFPEIRRGALPGVVSVAAQRRLSVAACRRLMCTGDAIDAPAAQRLGLVDVAGGWEELEAALARLVARLASVGAACLARCCTLGAAPLPPQTHAVQLEADGEGRVVRIEASGEAAVRSACEALAALTADAAPSLRVVLLGVEGGASSDAEAVAPKLASLLDVVMASLVSRGVAVVCEATGRIAGGALLLCAAAHYRIVDPGANFEWTGDGGAVRRQLRAALHPADAAALAAAGRVDAAGALALGLASEVAASAAERGAQFAHWLAVQPQTGMRHMLQLTLRGAVAAPPTPAAAGKHAAEVRRLLLADGSSGEAGAQALKRLAVAPSATAPAHEVVDGGAATMVASEVRALLRQERTAPSPPQYPPPVAPGPRRSRHAGIHALEVYTPRHCARAAELEAAHGVAGKYTEGLLMREWAACDEDEDVASMALTAVRRLVEGRGVRWEDVGMVQVGSESLLDRSKSLKSHLMALFPAGAANVEGVDAYHACYGGTASLLACANWVGSEAWDGRWAVCVCTDVSDAPAQYPFMNGAAAVAMLVGADAPLALEGRRHTHVAHEWDFYKPVGWPTMGPIVDPIPLPFATA